MYCSNYTHNKEMIRAFFLQIKLICFNTQAKSQTDKLNVKKVIGNVNKKSVKKRNETDIVKKPAKAFSTFNLGDGSCQVNGNYKLMLCIPG